MHWLFYVALLIAGSTLFHIFSKFSNTKADPILGFVVMQGAAFLAALFIFFIYRLLKPENLMFANFELSSLHFAIMAGIAIGLTNCAVFLMYNAAAPISIAVPLTRTGVVVGAVMAGLILFGETLGWVRSAGILLAVFSSYLMMYKPS